MTSSVKCSVWTVTRSRSSWRIYNKHLPISWRALFYTQVTVPWLKSRWYRWWWEAGSSKYVPLNWCFYVTPRNFCSEWAPAESPFQGSFGHTQGSNLKLVAEKKALFECYMWYVSCHARAVRRWMPRLFSPAYDAWRVTSGTTSRQLLRHPLNTDKYNCENVNCAFSNLKLKFKAQTIQV